MWGLSESLCARMCFQDPFYRTDSWREMTRLKLNVARDPRLPSDPVVRGCVVLHPVPLDTSVSGETPSPAASRGLQTAPLVRAAPGARHEARGCRQLTRGFCEPGLFSKPLPAPPPSLRRRHGRWGVSVSTPCWHILHLKACERQTEGASLWLRASENTWIVLPRRRASLGLRSHPAPELQNGLANTGAWLCVLCHGLCQSHPFVTFLGFKL